MPTRTFTWHILRTQIYPHTPPCKEGATRRSLASLAIRRADGLEVAGRNEYGPDCCRQRECMRYKPGRHPAPSDTCSILWSVGRAADSYSTTPGLPGSCQDQRVFTCSACIAEEEWYREMNVPACVTLSDPHNTLSTYPPLRPRCYRGCTVSGMRRQQIWLPCHISR